MNQRKVFMYESSYGKIYRNYVSFRQIYTIKEQRSPSCTARSAVGHNVGDVHVGVVVVVHHGVGVRTNSESLGFHPSTRRHRVRMHRVCAHKTCKMPLQCFPVLFAEIYNLQMTFRFFLPIDKIRRGPTILCMFLPQRK